MRVELPSWGGPLDDPRRLVGVVDGWTADVALARLVTVFGGSRRLGTLEELDAFAGEHWDFRKGRERNLAERALLNSEQERAVASAAPSLGLSGIHEPSLRHYDTIIMTGGMVRAGIVKPRFVASLLAGGLTTDDVVFLGAHRPFAGDESVLARALGVSGDDEVDAMEEGLRQAFPGGRGSGTRRDPTVTVLAAPSSDPERRRANTADTYAHWIDTRGPAVGHSVLVVTTPIYVPYQGAGAVELLGLGAGLAVETVGADAAAQDLGPLSQPFTAAHHLQELRAAIGAMRSLRAAALRNIP